MLNSYVMILIDVFSWLFQVERRHEDTNIQRQGMNQSMARNNEATERTDEMFGELGSSAPNVLKAG